MPVRASPSGCRHRRAPRRSAPAGRLVYSHRRDRQHSAVTRLFETRARTRPTARRSAQWQKPWPPGAVFRESPIDHRNSAGIRGTSWTRAPFVLAWIRGKFCWAVTLMGRFGADFAAWAGRRSAMNGRVAPMVTTKRSSGSYPYPPDARRPPGGPFHQQRPPDRPNSSMPPVPALRGLRR